MVSRETMELCARILGEFDEGVNILFTALNWCKIVKTRKLDADDRPTNEFLCVLNLSAKKYAQGGIPFIEKYGSSALKLWKRELGFMLRWSTVIFDDKYCMQLRHLLLHHSEDYKWLNLSESMTSMLLDGHSSFLLWKYTIPAFISAVKKFDVDLFVSECNELQTVRSDGNSNVQNLLQILYKTINSEVFQNKDDCSKSIMIFIVRICEQLTGILGMQQSTLI
ncbi:hypothetical protein GJ496_005518 [Pomphorhynchus laevis]|nr:hypothetical protein GJ496_005518 [Pomphorhynchus laevis]